VSAWFAGVKPFYDEAQKSPESPAAGEDAGADAAAADTAAAPDDAYADGMSPDDMGGTAEDGPTGPGWVIQLKGHHFHNGRSTDMEPNEGKRFIQSTFFKNLKRERSPCRTDRTAN